MNILFPEGRQKLGGIEDPERRIQEISRIPGDDTLRPGQAPQFAEDRLFEITNRAAQARFTTWRLTSAISESLESFDRS